MMEDTRLAALTIPLNTVPQSALTHEPARYEAGWLIVPEQRYQLDAILAEVIIPPTWTLFMDDGRPRIWIDVAYGTLCIIYHAESFPALKLGERFPRIFPKWIFAVDLADPERSMWRYFDGYDMHEVDARRQEG